MNKELEEKLKEIFLQWRKDVEQAEDNYNKDTTISFEDCAKQEDEYISSASRKMFDAIVHLSNW